LWDCEYGVLDRRVFDAESWHARGAFERELPYGEKAGIADHLVRYRPGTSIMVVTMLSDKSFPEFDTEKMRGQGDFVIVTDPKLPRSFSSDPPPKPAPAKK
jgi:hypothetical protein